MSLKEELLNAAKPFLMKEGLDSSKEIIANNSTSFDEMGMANSKPGEFSQEEITDPENLINISKMSNDNTFNADENSESETVVSIVGINDGDTSDELRDLVNLGTGKSCECEDDMCSKECGHRMADIIESILRKKDRTFLESLNEADLSEEELDEIVNYWPGFTNDKPDKGKYVTHLASRLRNNMGDIESGKLQIPDDIRNNFKDKDLIGDWKQYNNSNRGDPEYKKAVIATAMELAPGDENAQRELIHNPTDEMCNRLAERLNKKLGSNTVEFNIIPGEDLFDKYSQNYKNARRTFTNAYLNAFEGKWQLDILNKFNNHLNNKAAAPEVAAAPVDTLATPAISDEDLALLKQYNISADNPEAPQVLAALKKMLGNTTAAKKTSRTKKAVESTLTEKLFGSDKHYIIQASDTLENAKAAKGQFVKAIAGDGRNFELVNDHSEATNFKNPKQVIEMLHSGQCNCNFDSTKMFYTPMESGTVGESSLTESDYAGNLSYNPDKRLNASDILNAVKNAVKPELAPALSVVKNVDANEEPSYAIQNIDEKELPEKLEIDTNTDKKVVLKKDGNSYKFDK